MPPAPRRLQSARLAQVRVTSQLLTRPAALRDPAEVVRRSGGIQAQDASAARLGIRARAASPSAADVERARSEERSIVRTWAMRGTLHLLATDDLAWQWPLFASRELEWSRKRLSEALGVDERAQRRAVSEVERMLESAGTVARGELLDRLEEAGIAFDRHTAGHHLPRLAVLEGVACLGPERGGQTTYVLAREWVGELAEVDRDRALAELARRYLAAFAPADERDMAAWSGLGLGECRAGIAAIDAELVEVRIGDRRLAMPRAARLRAPRGRLVRLLPGFDNYLLGHSSREFAISSEQLGRVWPGGGIIRPTLLVDGAVAGTWRTRRAGGRVAITLDPFAPLDEEVRAAVAAEVEDVGRFEGMPAVLADRAAG